MRKQVNLTFLGVLVGTAAVLTVGVHYLHAYQVRRNAGNLLGQADRAQSQGRLQQAADYFYRYLGFEPADTEALAQYGLLLAHEQIALNNRTRLRAFVTLQQVLVREPDRPVIRRKLARVAMALRRYPDAREQLQTLLKAAGGDAELERLLGECEEAAGQYTQAAEWFAAAAEHAPAQTESYLRRARLLRRRLGTPADADAVMDTLVQRNPASAPARLARAQYFKEIGSAERGADDVAVALKLAPEQPEVLLAAAELAEAQEEPERARDFLQRGSGLYPQDVRMPQALAWLEVRAGRREAAVEWLRRSLKIPCDDARTLWNTANLFIEAAELEAARDLAERLRKESSVAPTLGYLHARLLLSERKWFQACRAFEQVRPRLVQVPELTLQTDLYLGQCYQQLGNADLQLAAYRRAVNQEPMQTPARLGLAAALLSVGRLDEALNEYRVLMPRVPAARVAVARLLLLKNLHLPAAERQWGEFESVLAEAARAKNVALPVLLLQAEFFVAQGRPAEAQKLLENARDQQPHQVEPWLALAGLSQRRGERDAALRILQEAERRLGDRAELRLARVRHWARRRGKAATEALTALERDLSKGTAEEQIQLLRELADARYAAGDAVEAKRLWRELARRQPDQLDVRLVLFDLALQAADEAAVAEVLAEIRGIEGAGALWHYGEAARAVLQARLGRDGDWLNAARAHLAEVTAQRPVWSRAPLLAAGLEELDGNLERAVENYQRAIELGNRQPGIIRRLVQLLYERRRYAEAELVIRKLLEQEEAPISGDLGRLAAEIALRTQHRERALELAGQAVSASSRDYRDHVWLGQILWALGQPAKAEAALRHATTLAENVPDPWVALIQHLARTGQKDQAEAAIEQARVKLAGNQVRLALAQCYEAVGRRDQAEAEYLAARTEQSGERGVLRAVAEFYLRNGQPEKAESPLQALLEPKAPSAETAWARRNLAVVLALRGDFEKLRDAAALLDNQKGARRETDSDRRARAVVLALQPHRRKEAIRLFEELLRRQPPTPHEQFLLARLYEGQRDWPKAREQFLSLLTSPQGSNPLYLAHYVRSLLNKGEVTEARSWLTRLEKLEPEAWRTVDLRARVLHAEKRDAEAVALLQAQAARPDTDLGRMASLLEHLDQPAAAEALYRRDAAQSNDTRRALALAEHLGRQKRVEEALALCERAWSTHPAAAVAGTSLGVIRAGQADARQIHRVEGWLQAAVAKEPKSVPVLLPWAELLDFQGRYEEARRAYQAILDQDRKNILALNNLAWLLALKFEATDEALELLNRALALVGPVPDLLDTRGSIYVAAGRAEPAIQDLEQAVAEAPSAANCFHLAQAYYLAKNRSSAMQALRRAQTAGLAPGRLHPLERSGYEQLLGDLVRK